MNWTHTPPDVPGFYWLQIGRDVPQIVEVVETNDKHLFWYFTTRDTEGTIAGPHFGFLWSGPIKQPKLESTVKYEQTELLRAV